MHIKGEKLSRTITLTESECRYFDGETILFVYNPYYFGLINPDDPDDPVRKQAIPTDRERTVLPCETEDPLSDRKFSPLPRLIHRYKSRVLLLVTDKCALYCRHCFRRHFTGEGHGTLTEKELSAAVRYIGGHPEIREVLLSGGDPLTLSDKNVGGILKEIRSVSPKLVIRLGTRIPVVLPARMTERLADTLAEYKPLWTVTHFNHIRELTAEARTAINRLTGRGIPVANQSVMLRGVNDSVEELKKLFEGLVAAGIKPYYLLQGDLAAGTSHFRVPIKTTMKIYRELRKELSGLSMPVLAVDLPDGGGKIPLSADYIAGEENDRLLLKNSDGEIFGYPLED